MNFTPTSNEFSPEQFLFSINEARKIYNPVSKFAHKGTNGTGLLIAGCTEMPGAAILAAKAAFRSGIGKLIVHTPKTVTDKIIPLLPEVIINIDENLNYFSKINEELINQQSIAIGCGLGKNNATKEGFEHFLIHVKHPIIIDADAINLLAENANLLAFVPKNSIITPHSKEFDRLSGKSENSSDREEKAKEFAKKHQLIVILKGHASMIAMPSNAVFRNTTGNQGMATAGSGDVLTGIILGCLAKGYSPENAALLGVFLHGLAGDIALRKQSYESLIASDIIENLGLAFKKIAEIEL